MRWLDSRNGHAVLMGVLLFVKIVNNGVAH